MDYLPCTQMRVMHLQLYGSVEGFIDCPNLIFHLLQMEISSWQIEDLQVDLFLDPYHNNELEVNARQCGLGELCFGTLFCSISISCVNVEDVWKYHLFYIGWLRLMGLFHHH